MRSNDAQDGVSTTSVALKALLCQDTVADIAEDTVVTVSRIHFLADLAQVFQKLGLGLTTSDARLHSLRASEQVGQAETMAALGSSSFAKTSSSRQLRASIKFCRQLRSTCFPFFILTLICRE